MNGQTQRHDLFHTGHQPWALDWEGRAVLYAGRHSVPWRRDLKGEVIPEQIYRHTHCSNCGSALEEHFYLRDGTDLAWRFQEARVLFADPGDDSGAELAGAQSDDWDLGPPMWRLIETHPDGRGVTAHTCLCSAACAQAWIEAVRTGTLGDRGWWCGEHADAYRPDLTDEEYEAWRDECYDQGQYW